eukprot:TRINITY_DN297_c0_g1_i2.p1 TRINITY_DN297_c0_g1~~TRINITY_DN297_c0_g1_i2.p1  ORF type:complete len:937 (+),score=372.89 TRINITY_DN297_c0_g1_i2:94-2904(+)
MVGVHKPVETLEVEVQQMREELRKREEELADKVRVAVDVQRRAREEEAAADAPEAEGCVAETAAAATSSVMEGELEGMLRRQDCVRNTVVIAHVDAGKTTLTDSLLSRGGLVSDAKAGRARLMDSGEEQQRGITINAAAVSLAFRTEAARGGTCVVNLIDSPGHVDFNAEVTSAMRVSDGALVVIDAVEGVQVQTELVLRQALTERVVPCMVVNKVDRLLTQLQLPPEEVYQRLSVTVDTMAALARDGADATLANACRDDLSRDVAPLPEEGSVVFASGLHGWAFSVDSFARLYEKRVGVKAERLRQKLWGDHFWNAKRSKWSSAAHDADGEPLPRAFCHFVLRPVVRMLDACKEGDWEGLRQEVERLWGDRWSGLLRKEEQVAGEAAFGLVMKRLLPAADALVELAAARLPSPVVAQRYRADVLCGAEEDRRVVEAVRRCDPDGPLVFYVTKLVPVERTWNFNAFGRVFSGVMRSGAKVHVLGHGAARIQRVRLLMVRKDMGVQMVPAGSLAAVAGLEAYVVKTATVVEPELSTAPPLKGLSHAVSPVVRATVECVAPAEQPQLAKALRWVQRSDPLVSVETDAGQHVIAGAGELHLQVCLHRVQERMEGPPGAAPGATKGLKEAQPAVAHRETVSACGPSCLSKSPAKLNRVWASAGPLADGLAEAIERGEVPTGHSDADVAVRSRMLVDRWGWERDEARSVWAVSCGNVLVDVSKGVPYLNEVKSHIVSAFDELMRCGPMCGEPVQGVCIRITDAKLHSDHAHRGPSELVPAASRAMKAALLRPESEPALLEPIFRCTIDTYADVAGAIRSEIPRRRGSVENEEHKGATALLDALVPVSASFGLTDKLRALTGGRAFTSCCFDHWRRLPGNPMETAWAAAAGGKKKKSPPKQQQSGGESAGAGDLSVSVVDERRRRRGLAGGPPTAADFEDKL